MVAGACNSRPSRTTFGCQPNWPRDQPRRRSLPGSTLKHLLRSLRLGERQADMDAGTKLAGVGYVGEGLMRYRIWYNRNYTGSGLTPLVPTRQPPQRAQREYKINSVADEPGGLKSSSSIANFTSTHRRSGRRRSGVEAAKTAIARAQQKWWRMPSRDASRRSRRQ